MGLAPTQHLYTRTSLVLPMGLGRKVAFAALVGLLFGAIMVFGIVYSIQKIQDFSPYSFRTEYPNDYGLVLKEKALRAVLVLTIIGIGAISVLGILLEGMVAPSGKAIESMADAFLVAASFGASYLVTYAVLAYPHLSGGIAYHILFGILPRFF